MRVFKFFFPCLAAAALTGCAGYHLGPVNGAVTGGKTIEIQPFSNRTLQPRLGDSVTESLRERVIARIARAVWDSWNKKEGN